MIRSFNPIPVLAPYIKHYLFYNIVNNGTDVKLKFLPSGNPYMVFNLKDSFHIYNSKFKNGILQSGSMVVGQQEAYYELVPGSKFSSLCVIFQPTGFYRLFNITLKEIINNSIPLKDLIHDEISRRVEDMYSEDNDASLIVRELDTYFGHYLQRKNKAYNYVEATLPVIRKEKGLVTIKELADFSNTSERNFRRRFLEVAGMRPKKYILISRLWHIIHAAKDPLLKVSWSDLTYNLGYYDQMHLIKEFKLFSGETPAAYFAKFNNNENVLQRIFLTSTE